MIIITKSYRKQEAKLSLG